MLWTAARLAQLWARSQNWGHKVCLNFQLELELVGYLLWRQPESGLGITGSRTPGVAKAPSPTPDTPVAPQISSRAGTKKTIRHADGRPNQTAHRGRTVTV
jgi:hypothetical protein